MSEPDIQNDVAEAETPQTMTQARTAEAEEDAILDRLLSDGDETEVEAPAKQPEAVVAKPVPSPANPDRDRAVAVLKRDGVPQAIIDGTSDEVLAEWAEKASKRQKDVDSYSSKMKELEKKVAASSKTADDSDDDDVIVEDDEVEPSDDNDSDSDSVNDEQTDDDEPVSKSKSIKKMEEELAELRKSQQDFQQKSLLYQVEVADAAFRHLYGDTAPEKDAVVNEMNRLGAAKPGSYQSMMQLAEEAYNNLAGPLKKQNARKASQPTSSTKVSRTERPVNPADAEDAILDAILDGKPLPEARQSIRK